MEDSALRCKPETVFDVTTVTGPTPTLMGKHKVIRRLRALKQPITLFGETDEDRFKRLVTAEQNIQIEDETAGGQQENIHLQIKRLQNKSETIPSSLQADKLEEISNGNEVDPQQAALMESFRAAAVEIAEKRMTLEERLTKWLKKWSSEWEADLAARAEDVKISATGRQATLRYQETMQYLQPLYSRLKNKALDPELLAGISLVIEAVKQRNYLHANKIYLGLAIGNSPWPIGVTQVGLHERSAREKISFKGSSGQAHIMNDEATRKFIQALKRVITFCQRRYPTDPSRSVDFDAVTDEGRGAIGSGSDRMALLEAMQKGEKLAPTPAPGIVNDKGEVFIPEKWQQILKGALKDVT